MAGADLDSGKPPAPQLLLEFLSTIPLTVWYSDCGASGRRWAMRAHDDAYNSHVRQRLRNLALDLTASTANVAGW